MLQVIGLRLCPGSTGAGAFHLRRSMRRHPPGNAQPDGPENALALFASRCASPARLVGQRANMPLYFKGRFAAGWTLQASDIWKASESRRAYHRFQPHSCSRDPLYPVGHWRDSRAALKLRCWLYVSQLREVSERGTRMPERMNKAENEAVVPSALQADLCPWARCHGSDGAGVAGEEVRRGAAGIHDGVVAVEDGDRELVAAEVLPDVFDWVEFGRVGRSVRSEMFSGTKRSLPPRQPAPSSTSTAWAPGAPGAPVRRGAGCAGAPGRRGGAGGQPLTVCVG